MRALVARSLQKATRAAVRIPVLRYHAWRTIQALRSYFAESMPSIELETRFDDGVRLRTMLSSHIEAQLFWQGFQEADESAVEWLKRLLPKNGVFVDIGANIGSFALVAANHARQGWVHAFEPSVYHLERLRYNIALNQFLNITVIPLGLSDESKDAVLHLPIARTGMSNTGGASLYECHQSVYISKPESVRLMRLDDYWDTTSSDRLDVIKIDVEGAELEALRGGLSVISRLRPVVIMEVDIENLRRAGHAPHDVIEFWGDLGYRVDMIGRQKNLTPVYRAEDLRPHQNILCRPS